MITRVGVGDVQPIIGLGRFITALNAFLRICVTRIAANFIGLGFVVAVSIPKTDN